MWHFSGTSIWMVHVMYMMSMCILTWHENSKAVLLLWGGFLSLRRPVLRAIANNAVRTRRVIHTPCCKLQCQSWESSKGLCLDIMLMNEYYYLNHSNCVNRRTGILCYLK